MTLAATRTGRPATPRWMMIALFGSLALNLIVVGAAAGFAWRHNGVQAANASQPLSPSLLSYASTLSPERHKELSARTEEQRQNVRPLRRQLREAREDVVNALVTEPFEKERYDAAQSRLLIADEKAREAVHQLYAAIAVNMTLEERRGFADWRQKRRPMRNLLDEPDKQAGGHR